MDHWGQGTSTPYVSRLYRRAGALSCQPVEISGRNWLARRAAAEAIRHDPDWHNGFYEQNPRHYIYSAAGNFTTESPTRIQEMAPTLAAANALYERRLAAAAQGDANNQLWAIEAIQNYNPEPDLDKITAKVLLINDAEDHANPPELGTVERAMQRVKHGRYVLIPAGPDTHGHFSHYYARLWKPYLIEFMATLGPEQTGAAAVHAIEDMWKTRSATWSTSLSSRRK
jgi:homoserine O-acetyltransferase